MAKIKKWVDPNSKLDIPHLSIDEQSGEFWVVKRIGKAIKKKNLKTDKLTLAKARMMNALAELGDENAKAKGLQKLIRDHFEKHFERKRDVKKVKASTLIRVRSVWENNLEPFFGNLTASQITPQTIDNFISWHRKTRPDVQLYNPLRYWSSLQNYLIRIGELSPVQAPKIEMPKDQVIQQNKKKGRVISFADFEKIAKEAPAYLKLMLEIAYRVGMRKMEIASLHEEQVIEIAGRLFLKLEGEETKTGLARTIPVPQAILDAFKAHIETVDGYLFPNNRGSFKASQVIDRDWNMAKEAAGIKGKLRFHDLRHTCATNFARMKVNPMMAVTLLGMSLRTYQKTYLNLSAQDLIEVADISYGETRNVEKMLQKSE